MTPFTHGKPTHSTTSIGCPRPVAPPLITEPLPCLETEGYSWAEGDRTTSTSGWWSREDYWELCSCRLRSELWSSCCFCLTTLMAAPVRYVWEYHWNIFPSFSLHIFVTMHTYFNTSYKIYHGILVWFAGWCMGILVCLFLCMKYCLLYMQTLGFLAQDGILRVINVHSCKQLFQVGSHDLVSDSNLCVAKIAS